MFEDDDIINWIELLNDPKLTKVEIVGDLLKHANEDQMSHEDRVACQRAIVLSQARPSWRVNHIGAVGE